MKNKLTTEEQRLQSKLNEAEFTYQEGHWAEMEQLVSKKGVWAKYGSIFKAVIAFVGIVGSVVLLKEVYQTEQPNEIKTEVDTPSNSSQLTPQITNEELVPNDQEETAKNLDKINKTMVEEIPSSVEVKQKIEKLNSKELELVQTPIQEEQSIKTLENKEEQKITKDATVYAEVLYVELESAPCLNKMLSAKAILKNPLVEQDVYFKWTLNGIELKGNEIQHSFLIESPGKKQIIAKAYYKDQLLSEGKNDFVVEEPTDLSFTSRDLDDIFYDHNVNLKVNEPKEGSYRWYIDKYDRVQFGKETAWGLVNEGKYDMNLEYISPNGCVSTTVQTIEMQQDFVEAFPNRFTPDNDGHNEVFILEALQAYRYKKFEMRIFDLKGKLVFQTNDPFKGWNGRMLNTGSVLPIGEYYAWFVEIENNNGRKKSFKGKVKTVDF